MTLFNSGGQVVIAKSQSFKVVKVSSKGIPEATRLAASQVSLGLSLQGGLVCRCIRGHMRSPLHENVY